MIQSIYQIDFITAGGTRRLVSVGDVLTDEISPRVAQQMEEYSPIGCAWGGTAAAGGAKTSVSWTVKRSHSSHAAMRDACMAAAASFPTGETGTLRITITGGATWDILNATVSSSDPMPAVCAGFHTLTGYSVTGGEMVVVSGLAMYAGIPIKLITTTHTDLTTAHNALT